MKNKCEEAGMAHAWRNSNEMWGFSVALKDTCANCQLTRSKHSKTEEWYSYSDGRPNEPILNIRPL